MIVAVSGIFTENLSSHFLSKRLTNLNLLTLKQPCLCHISDLPFFYPPLPHITLSSALAERLPLAKTSGLMLESSL